MLKRSEIDLAITKTLGIIFYLENKSKQKTLMNVAIDKNEAYEVQKLSKLLREAPNIQLDEKNCFQHFRPWTMRYYSVNLQKRLIEGGKTSYMFLLLKSCFLVRKRRKC